MILKGDASQLEWRTYVEWSRDPVGIQEIKDGVDVHSINQDAFALPERVIAKIFLFRWIYWGPAYAYANDPDFMKTSASEKFWQEVIDRANEKYNTLYNFQLDMIRRVQNGEIIQIPSGRQYQFELKETKRGYEWPVRDIVNWPNQGFANDLMTIARVSLRNRLRTFPEYEQGRIKLFNTVHDDIEVDVDNDPNLCYNVSVTMENVFRDIPRNFEKIYKKDFITPLAGEVSFDVNLMGTLYNEKKKSYGMRKFDASKGPEQFVF